MTPNGLREKIRVLVVVFFMKTTGVAVQVLLGLATPSRFVDEKVGSLNPSRPVRWGRILISGAEPPWTPRDA
ncbi:hypothetical protein X992_5492 [Burkholderia pseudomallei MSHR5492]|nr:hypothetical protein X992_5492 [Burkholderia pseudomallei MSHR5492]